MPKKTADAVLPDVPREYFPMPAIESMPLAHLVEWSGNPRKTFDGIEELAEDVRQRGVLQPILVRPNADKFEIIFGARRYRAAKLAGLTEVPVMVRRLSDVEALEVAIVENAKRADVHPLEEADAYRELHTKHGYDVDTIAAKVGKSRAAVYARMKLCELGEAGRKAFFEGKLSASVALLVARLADPEAQAKAVESVTRPDWSGQIPSFRSAVQIVQQHYTHELSEAPFDPKDEHLLAEAGACIGCPKRSGNTPDLVEQLGGPDVCTDGKCFRMKTEAASANKRQVAEAMGRKVVEGEEAKKILSYGGGYERVESLCFDAPKSQTFDQLTKKLDVERVVAIDGHGVAHELVRKKDVKEALVEAGKEWAKKIHVPGERGPGSPTSDAEKKAREKERIERAARRRAIEIIVQNVDGLIEWERDLWDVLLESMLVELWRDTLKTVAERRGLLEKKPNQDLQKIIRKHAEELNDYQVRALVLELAISRQPGFGGVDLVKVAGAPFDVDLKELEREERQAKKQKAKGANASCKSCGEPCGGGGQGLCYQCAQKQSREERKPKPAAKKGRAA